jgi:beta-mannosidase
MARIKAASNYDVEPLGDWQMAETPDGSTELPDAGRLAWRPAQVPGTVASALRAAKAFDFDTPSDFDAVDHCFRCEFRAEAARAGESVWLRFGGLASLAEVWLNGEHVLSSDNMFVEHEIEVSRRLRGDNELVIRFRSLTRALAIKRPRPRFRTRLIEQQQLRWFRTTFLGRMPGWNPRVAAVGPWRGVFLERRRGISLETVRLRASVEAGRARVHAHFSVGLGGHPIEAARLRVGSRELSLELASTGASGELSLDDAARWWPNGHGEQARHEAQLSLVTGGVTHVLDFDPLAFRSLEAAPDRAGLALLVNGVELRCRGACWTPTDIVSLGDDASTLATLRQVHAAGMNMLRVSGIMIYESDLFYEECDRLGIMVWQDFMFANCDYPGENDAFATSVRREAEQFLSRTETRACVSVLCGNSEVAQQISMLGLAKELWQPALFEHALRDISAQLRPDVPYVASSPSGGALPFQANAGVTHYYGVGAYLRPLDDARRAEVSFASECLAFANIPEPVTLEHLLDGRAPFHDPRWKARVPRDSGPAWDFDDVRDHYTKALFDVDPVLLRYQDPERALELGRVASGQVMARTLGEWRRRDSPCRGALIWLLRDIWPGAGWGLIDAAGLPKAAYYYVRRAMQPRALFISDEGVNGLQLHVANDPPEPLEAKVELTLWRDGNVKVAAASRELLVPARGSVELAAAELFEHFIDTTHAYRFGPPAYEVAEGALKDRKSGAVLSRCCHFIGSLPRVRSPDLGLQATVKRIGSGDWLLSAETAAFAHAVAVDVPGFAPEDSYFDLSPDSEHAIVLRPLTGHSATPKGTLRALNAQSPTRISSPT